MLCHVPDAVACPMKDHVPCVYGWLGCCVILQGCCVILRYALLCDFDAISHGGLSCLCVSYVAGGGLCELCMHLY